MKAFDRQAPPAFWIDQVCRWVDLLAKVAPGEKKPGNKLHDWSVQKLTLADWFHETVRPRGEGAFCAYCDGLLETQSPKTIDHWVPQEMCFALALWWGNLFPACSGCQAAKGTRWSVSWLRPDVDDVEAWIRCDLASGLLEPADGVDEELRRRIQDTIDGLGLNRKGLSRERRLIARDLWSASDPTIERRPSIERLLERAQEGPYRFLGLKP